MSTCEFYFWKDFFTQEQIKDIYAIKSKNSFEELGNDASGNGGNLKHVAKVNYVEGQHLSGNFKLLNNEIQVVNRLNYGFNIDEIFATDRILFNEYDTENSYDWHKDGSNHPFYDYKFTIIINSSLGSYEGGDFEIFTNGGVLKVPQLNSFGSAIMFKSDIPHRVTPVTKGQRRSIVYWRMGPSFV